MDNYKWLEVNHRELYMILDNIMTKVRIVGHSSYLKEISVENT